MLDNITARHSVLVDRYAALPERPDKRLARFVQEPMTAKAIQDVPTALEAAQGGDYNWDPDSVPVRHSPAESNDHWAVRRKSVSTDGGPARRGSLRKGTPEANRRHRGAPFRTEEDLTRSFLRVLQRSAPGGWALLREIDAGVGVADLILVETQRTTRSELRLMKRVPPRLAPLLSPTVADQLTSLSTLMEATGTSRASALRLVSTLIALRLVRRAGETLYFRSVQSPPFEHVVAIEAKLRDWKRALTQAYRNRQFASQSWVVLDGYYSVSDTAIDSFIRAQVGLATCSSAGELKIHVHAETLPPSNLQKCWTAQAVIARSHRQPLRPLK